MTDPRALMAARNNADLYCAVFAAQGKSFDLGSFAFVSRDPPPAYYSALTILKPGHVAEVEGELHRLLRPLGGEVGFKDSFCEFPLGRPDLHLLFEASWIHRRPPAAPPPAPGGWARVSTPDALTAWEQAWKGSGSPTDATMFGRSLLERPDVAFLAKWNGSAIVAGCIGNLSDDCIGLSNVFSTDAAGLTFAEAARAVAALHPGLPVVGYARGQDLAQAEAAGFDPVAPLRVFLMRR